MKKIFLFMAAALTSLTMMAGDNDLLWDYSEGAPSNNPDNNLYYESKISDGPGTKNGLYGIKLNSSGFACFAKAAVAGKLKLTFSPRSGSNATSVEVWNCSGEASAHTKGDTKYVTTGQQTELGTQIVELTAEQNTIYLCRGPENVETCLTKIEFTENVARTFVDFKIEFRDNPYTVLEPAAGLPDGVVVDCPTYNGGQHGVQGGTITMPVDGTVKFTIGACQYSSTDITIKKDGEVYTTISNNAACGEQKPNYNQYVNYYYMGDAGTLTFEFGSQTYVPYFFAEAAEITPCEIIFKDQNGAEVARQETYEGATLGILPEASVLPEIGEGNAFRGWFYSNGKKAKIGDPINGNTTIHAKVTPIETVTVGSVQVYDFTNPYFYPEDHETIEMKGGYYHDGQHGWAFTNGEQFAVETTGKKAIIVLEICQYGTEGAIWKETYLTPEVPGVVTPESCAAVGTEGQQMTFKFDYNADELIPVVFTLQSTGGENYLHKVTVYNVEDFMEKDETTGFYMVPTGDVASFLMALAQAEPGDKIFLPRGLYDLGETCLTTIAKNNISIIGESMEQTIIRNAPDAAKESIDKTATIKINKNVEGTYLQDLTIQNALDYYKNNNGRAVALWDQGTKTVCKNVRLLSYQDTYYSNLVKAVKYFEDCEIHGTVDFICGDGSVYFKNNTLVAEQRNRDGGGSDALTASNADASDKGYVFESCTVKYAEGIQGTKPVVSFGRAWNNAPKTIFLNTVLDNSNGELNMVKEASAQKDKIERWTLGAMNALPEKFGEFNSMDVNGNVVSPASNEVTFVLGTNEKTMETILTANDAATYTMEYTLGEWSATAAKDVEQIRKNVFFSEDGVMSWNASEEGVYLVYLHSIPYCITTETSFDVTSVPTSEIRELYEKYGRGNIELTAEYYVRFANGRGGFGPAVYPGQTPESLESIQQSAVSIQKFFRDGQVIIVRDNKEYNVLGTQL